MTPAVSPHHSTLHTAAPRSANPGNVSFSETLQAGSNPQADGPKLDQAFERWWKSIPRLEGTLKDWQANPHNRADRGGRTNFGITERAFMGCAGAAGLPKTAEAFEAMSVDQAKQIAKAIWKTSGVHQIRDPAVATVVGDWFWGSNTGAWKGVKEVLSSLGTQVGEGQGLDPRSLEALNSLPPELLVERISNARHQHHQGIVETDATQHVFLSGWQARVEFMRASALTFVQQSTPEPELERHPRRLIIQG